MVPIKKRLGEKIKTNTGICEVVIYNNSDNITVEFEDGYKVKTTYADFKRKNIKNPNYPNIYGIGFTGIGEYNSKNNKKARDCWTRMLQRCYDSKFHLKQPTYKECSVDSHWHNFQNFAFWFELHYNNGWVLDKDLLIKNNKIYSTKTCCFLPKEVNTLFTKRQNKRGDLPIGVIKNYNKFLCSFTKNGKSFYGGSFNTKEEAFEKYKFEKEKYIKEVAYKWRLFLPNKVLEAMNNYKVEYND